MNQIKEVHWNAVSRESVLDYWKNSKDLIPKFFEPETYKSLKKSSREFLEKKLDRDFQNKLIITSGHQPELFHPGILFKELIVNSLAKEVSALPLHIIVDTDATEFSFHLPRKKNNSAYLENYQIKSGEIFSKYEIKESERKTLLQIWKEQLVTLENFVSEKNIEFAKKSIEVYISLLEKNESLLKIHSELKREFFLNNQIESSQVYLSDLIQIESFKAFVSLIKNNLSEFQKAYNLSLDEFRKEHKIKNHAQPIPNLLDQELPFWILDKTTNQRRALKLEDSLEDSIILPKAVTLTMFLRLFLSDFFIHGKGGGRYEEVSEKIFENFFQMKASPYSTASITMNLNNLKGFSLPNIDEKGLEAKIRDTVFSPEKFLPDTNFLTLEKKSLQAQFSDPNVNKKELHQKIQGLNEKMTLELKSEIDELEKLKRELPELLKTKEVFESRILPFFYYDLSEIEDYLSSNLKFC